MPRVAGREPVLLLREFRDAAVEFGNRQSELLTADGMGGDVGLPQHLGAGQAERLQALLALRVPDDTEAARTQLFQLVEPVLDLRLGVDQPFSAVMISLSSSAMLSGTT